MWNDKITRDVNGSKLEFYLSCNPKIAEYQKCPINLEKVNVVKDETQAGKSTVMGERELVSVMYKLKRSIASLESIQNRTPSQEKLRQTNKLQLKNSKDSYWSK